MKKFYFLILFFFFSIPCLLLSQSKEWQVNGWTDNSDMSYVKIRCADSLNCMIWGDIALGWGHFFTRTIDGGKHWKTRYLDSSKRIDYSHWYMITQINAIEYPSTNLFLAVGDSGFILRTKDRGLNWQKYYIDKSKKFMDIRMLNDKFGIVISLIFDKEITEMLSTSDGGTTWTKMNMPDECSSAEFIDYQILDSTLVVALIKRPGKDKELLWIHGDWEKYETYPASKYCWNISFLNQNKGWMCGGTKIDDLNDTQLIMHTEDGGKTWETQWDYKFFDFRLNGIKFINDSIGMATGGNASFLSTYNGGKTWRFDTLKKQPDKGRDPNILSPPEMPSITTAYVIVSGDYIYKYTRDWALGAEDEETETEQLSLDQNKPNPAASRTEISYTLSSYSHVRLNIYDMLGNIRKALIDEYEGPGEHSIIFTAEGLPQGTYFYRLETEKGSVAKQMVVFR